MIKACFIILFIFHGLSLAAQSKKRQVSFHLDFTSASCDTCCDGKAMIFFYDRNISSWDTNSVKIHWSGKVSGKYGNAQGMCSGKLYTVRIYYRGDTVTETIRFPSIHGVALSGTYTVYKEPLSHTNVKLIESSKETKVYTKLSVDGKDYFETAPRNDPDDIGYLPAADVNDSIRESLYSALEKNKTILLKLNTGSVPLYKLGWPVLIQNGDTMELLAHRSLYYVVKQGPIDVCILKNGTVNSVHTFTINTSDPQVLNLKLKEKKDEIKVKKISLETEAAHYESVLFQRRKDKKCLCFIDGLRSELDVKEHNYAFSNWKGTCVDGFANGYGIAYDVRHQQKDTSYYYKGLLKDGIPHGKGAYYKYRGILYGTWNLGKIVEAKEFVYDLQPDSSIKRAGDRYLLQVSSMKNGISDLKSDLRDPGIYYSRLIKDTLSISDKPHSKDEYETCAKRIFLIDQSSRTTGFFMHKSTSTTRSYLIECKNKQLTIIHRSENEKVSFKNKVAEACGCK
jgi:hypothetical protein